MSEKTCKCCGQTLPVVQDFDIPMTETHKRIVAAVQKAGKHGIATDRLFNTIWGDAYDGGPTSGHKVLHVHISKINKLLAPRGLRLTGEHTGTRYTYGRYILRELGEPHVAHR